MNQLNTTNLTLIEFLDKVGAALETPDGWYNSEDLWMEYFNKADVPNDGHYLFGDWVEVAPAMKALAWMIRAGVFE